MASTIPTALAALVTVLRDAGLPVWDGPTVSDSSLTEAVVVGFSGADDLTAVEGATIVSGATVGPMQEQYTIRCAVLVSDGSGDITSARTRAYVLWDTVTATVVDSPSLGVPGLLATLSDHTLEQSQSAAGAQVMLRFGLACDGWTT